MNYEDLFQQGIEELYGAESQLVKALPKMMAAASSEDLASAFATHLEETKGQLVRLENIFEQMGGDAKGRDSEALRGLLSDGEKLIADIGKSPALDVALAAAARKVEHWEMVGYETVSAIAEMLGQQDTVELLQETLTEESAADETFADIMDAILDGDVEEEEVGPAR
jgi:ferritin-like metal-binding protein YciE